MTAMVRGIFSSARRLTAITAIAIATIVMMGPFSTDAHAQVQYVQICTLYGAGFFYLPATDICVNVAENDARENTLNGTWRWRIPNNPRTWSQAPQNSCTGGTLVKFGDITSSGLTVNSHGRFETKTRYQLKPSPGQYVASVMYKGGFTIPGPNYEVATLPSCPAAITLVTDATDEDCSAGDPAVGGGDNTCEVSCVGGEWEYTGSPFDNNVGQGNFCMFYSYNAPVLGPLYSFPLGCIDTTPQASLPETLVFSPDSPTPPAGVGQIYIVGANGNSWEVPLTSSVKGTLSVWLCLQRTAGTVQP